jgi:hypothetical protein
MTGAVARLLRVRLWVLIGITVLLAALDGLETLQPVDLGTLGRAGERLLSSRWADAFAEPRVQVGPLYLLVIGFIEATARAVDISTRLLLSIVAQVTVIALVVACVRVATSRRDELGALVELGAGATALAAGLTWTAYISGHMEEAVMGAVWMACAYAAKTDRPGHAGLALALAAGLKLWGLLGVPLLLLLDSSKDRMRALAIALGLSLAIYGPFFIWGEVATFEYRWPIKSPLLTTLLGRDDFAGWGLRAVQGALTLAAGTGLALWLRRFVGSVWAVPLGAIAVRIMLDPLPHYYFWMPFELLTIAGAGWVIANLRIWQAVVATAGTYVILLGRYLPMVIGYVARLSMATFLIGLVVARDEDRRRESRDIKSSTSRSDESSSG